MVGSGERLRRGEWWACPRFPIARFACRKTLAPDRYMGGMGRRMRTYGGTFDWKPSQPRPAKFRKQRVECPAPGAEVRRKAFRKFGSRSHCREATFLFLFVYNSHIGKLTHPRGAVPRFLSLRRFRETDRRLITTGARNELVSAPSMKRFCGAARAAPLATRALALRAFTGRTLSTVPAKPVRLDPQLESVLARFRARGGPNEKEGAARLVEDFERLQTRKVMRVLLVCSDYDSYTFEEDGLLTELVDAEYSDNHLSKPPTIERVSSPEKAISRVRENPSSFDLIITLLRNEGHNTNAASFVSSIQQEPLPRPRPRPSPDPRPDTRPTLRPDTHPSTHLSPRLSPSQSPNPNTHPHPHRTPPRPQPTRTPTLRSSTARCRTATPTPSPTPTPILTPTPTLSCAAQQRATRLAACFEPV